MSPLADAMRLVNNDQIRRVHRKVRTEPIDPKTLGGDVEELQPTIPCVAQRLILRFTGNLLLMLAAGMPRATREST